jgi:hypothetical protein
LDEQRHAGLLARRGSLAKRDNARGRR